MRCQFCLQSFSLLNKFVIIIAKLSREVLAELIMFEILIIKGNI